MLPFRTLQRNANKTAHLSFHPLLKKLIHCNLFIFKYYNWDFLKHFFTVTLGPHLLHVSCLTWCDHWEMLGVLFDLTCSHWATSCLQQEGGWTSGRTSRKEMCRKKGTKHILNHGAGWHNATPKFCMYATGIFPAIPITGKHTTGKWAGHGDSTQNTSECSKCTNKNTCY